MRYLLLLSAALACFGLRANHAWAGDVQGQVHVPDSKYQKDAVVYIDLIQGKTFDVPKEHAKIDQQGLKFIPHILPVLVGTTVDFQNDDDVLHNVFSPDAVAGKSNLGSWPRGETRSYTYKKLGSAVMLCSVHPEMEALVVVLPTPYFAQTDKDGSFRITDVPAGKYTLKVWSEKKWKAAPQQLAVPEKGEATAEFTLGR